jgi:glycosyltransferase involved in cell wall biosynthesis
MRLIVYTDYVYREVEGVIYAERSFAVFLAGLVDRFPGLTIAGRLDPGAGPMHYPLPAQVRFVGLPHYPSLTHPGAVARSMAESLRRFWRQLDDADRVWLLGPSPHAVAFALIARMRRRRVLLGVRQDYPTYVRSRRPGRRWMHHAADLLELAWRLLARATPVVVVGPELARHYDHSPARLELVVSLISEADVEAGRQAAARPYDGELRVLSVGRIDREKNPLMLAEVLELLRRGSPRWRLVICGEGPMLPALRERIAALGLSEHVELRGYVRIDSGLLDLYRSSHVFLHVSLTEGMPQVLLEAFASGVPVVATAVGGVPGAAGDAALLIGPNDADAAARAVHRAADDPQLRARLVTAGLERARRHSLEAELNRLAEFIAR